MSSIGTNANLDQLTPEQLRRVDAMLAEKLLGVKVELAGPGDWDYFYRTGEGWLCRSHDVEWYTTDPAAALSLLGKYEEWKIHKLEDGVHYVSVAKSFMHTALGRTLPLAICQAVMAAEGLEVPPDVE